ncbi:MAG: hypothetical protein J6L47_00825 [Alphaproteobacteria bacterium]|nr:hypothetical protein [Alphaproteobacteria bacterium]
MPNLNVGLGLALCCVNTASAYLQVSAGSAVGTYCYSDWEYPGDLLVIACECDAKGYTVDDCSTSEPDGTCYLGSSGGVDYYCDWGGESACSFCNCDSGCSEWSSPDSSGIVTRTCEDVDDSVYYYCNISQQTEYGCGSSRYKVSGGSTATSWVTCSWCPTFKSASGNIYGNTSTGNRSAVTACWLPAGTASNFSDTKGSGTEKFTSTCYYSN